MALQSQGDHALDPSLVPNPDDGHLRPRSVPHKAAPFFFLVGDDAFPESLQATDTEGKIPWEAYYVMQRGPEAAGGHASFSAPATIYWPALSTAQVGVARSPRSNWSSLSSETELGSADQERPRSPSPPC